MPNINHNKKQIAQSISPKIIPQGLVSQTRHIYGICLALLFAVFVFFRFYNMSTWADLNWDQVNNAWTSVGILHDHNFPLRFMVKGSSGLYIGPLYYYLVAGFYYLTNYDPIASPILAGFSAIIGFLVLYIIVRKLHGPVSAIIAFYIYTFSTVAIAADKVQWQPNFIPPVSLVLFYCLYNVIQGNLKYILWIGLLIGLAYHLHFTVFLFIGMVILALPLFPKKRETLYYLTGALGIIVIFLLPTIVYRMQNAQASELQSATGYALTNYHGFHMRRFLQIMPDAFIEVEKILYFKSLRIFFYFVPLMYSLVLWFSVDKRKTFVLSCLVFFWLIVPWLAFSTYSGEISDYYFSSFRFIVIMMCSYIFARALNGRWLSRFSAVVLLGYYAFYSISTYSVPYGNMSSTKYSVKKAIENGIEIPFVEGKLDSYLYYIYTKVLPKTSK